MQKDASRSLQDRSLKDRSVERAVEKDHCTSARNGSLMCAQLVDNG